MCASSMSGWSSRRLARRPEPTISVRPGFSLTSWPSTCLRPPGPRVARGPRRTCPLPGLPRVAAMIAPAPRSGRRAQASGPAEVEAGLADEAQQQPHRQPGDVRRRALDRLHEERPLSVHVVGAGLVERLAGRGVPEELPARSSARSARAPLDARARPPPRTTQTPVTTSCSRPARPRSMATRLPPRPGLAQDVPVAEHLGVGGEHRQGLAAGHRERLLPAPAARPRALRPLPAAATRPRATPRP